MQWGSMGHSGVGTLTAVEPIDFRGHSALGGVTGQHHGVPLLHLHRGHLLLRPLRSVCGAAMRGGGIGGGGGGEGPQRCGAGQRGMKGTQWIWGSSKTPKDLGWPTGNEGNPMDLGVLKDPKAFELANGG